MRTQDGVQTVQTNCWYLLSRCNATSFSSCGWGLWGSGSCRRLLLLRGRWPVEHRAPAGGAVLLPLQPRAQAVQVEHVATEQLLVGAGCRHLLAADDAHAVRALQVLGRCVGEAVQSRSDLAGAQERR